MDTSSTAPMRPRGRPRSEAVDQAIMDAVLRFMAEGGRLWELSMEGIAQAAGVGKATLYRRWPNKEALLLDLVVRMDEPEPQLVGDSARADLVRILEFMRQRGLAKRSRWLLRLAIGEMHAWPELNALYKERVVNPRRAAIREVVRRGIERGEFRADLDPLIVEEILVAPMLARTVLWEDAPLDDPGLAERIVDAAMQGVGARPAG